LLSFIEALLLHGETRPMTSLPARATSATSKIQGRYAVGEANRSLWPNSEVHEEFLPAMPALLYLECITRIPQTAQRWLRANEKTEKGYVLPDERPARAAITS
jgi:hypothetical protein